MFTVPGSKDAPACAVPTAFAREYKTPGRHPDLTAGARVRGLSMTERK
jgi:hypothetical protein